MIAVSRHAPAPAPQKSDQEIILAHLESLTASDKKQPSKGARAIANIFFRAAGLGSCPSSFQVTGTCLMAGSERLVDAALVDLILTHRQRGSNPLSVLEVAAGSTFPQHYEIGAPWLMRSLALQFPKRFNLTVSDLFSSRKVIVAVAKSPVPTMYVARNLDDLPVTPLSEPRKGGEFGKLFPKDAHAWVRPFLDAEVELSAFGLSVLPEVDYNSLKSSLGSRANSFDVLIGRNLYPLESKSEWQRIVDSLSDGLAPKGAALLHSDCPHRGIPKGMHPQDFRIFVQGK